MNELFTSAAQKLREISLIIQKDLVKEERALNCLNLKAGEQLVAEKHINSSVKASNNLDCSCLQFPSQGGCGPLPSPPSVSASGDGGGHLYTMPAASEHG